MWRKDCTTSELVSFVRRVQTSDEDVEVLYPDIWPHAVLESFSEVIRTCVLLEQPGMKEPRATSILPVDGFRAGQSHPGSAYDGKSPILKLDTCLKFAEKQRSNDWPLLPMHSFSSSRSTIYITIAELALCRGFDVTQIFTC